MSLDLVVLRGAQRCVESAAIHARVGRDDDALRDVALAIYLLNGARRDERYDEACASGLVVTESVFDHERDTGPSDDGERRE